MQTRKRDLFFLGAVILLSLSLASFASAAVLSSYVTPGASITNIALADPIGGGRADAMQQAIIKDLQLIPFIKLIDSRGIPGGARINAATASGAEFQRFLGAGAHMLLTANWVDSGQVELRAFEVSRGTFLFGNRYAVAGGDNGVLDVADKFCADLLEHMIGNGDFFRSTLAFSKSGGKNKKDIWAVKANGRYLRQLTNMPGEAISPAWSPDGRFVLFTHIDARSHALGVWDSANRNVQRIRFPGNTVIGPCFMPDNRVAVSLTDGRNPSIFLLNHAFQKERKLDGSTAIDVSPSVDASGTKMAFTSDRLGGPQIFLKDLRSGAASRISPTGGYNTDPSISPDGTLVAYAKLTGQGHRIYVYDLVKNTETQITFGPGSDEEPAFAPDNYFIAYMSRRGGIKQIYMTTRVGGDPKRVETGPGDASFPAWGRTR